MRRAFLCSPHLIVIGETWSVTFPNLFSLVTFVTVSFCLSTFRTSGLLAWIPNKPSVLCNNLHLNVITLKSDVIYVSILI